MQKVCGIPVLSNVNSLKAFACIVSKDRSKGEQIAKMFSLARPTQFHCLIKSSAWDAKKNTATKLAHGYPVIQFLPTLLPFLFSLSRSLAQVQE